MGPLRWGIMSAGKISHDFVVASGALPKDEHRIVAVAARNMESAKTFAKVHSIPKAYGSYEELAKDPKIDIVYVGAVNPQHFQLVKLCLNHGKHVLCEKPLAINVKETREMLELAKSKNLFLMEGMWSCFVPAYQELRRRIQNGSLGEVLQVIIQFGVALSADRFLVKELGGGSAINMGVYCAHLAQFVFGDKPIKIISGGHLNVNGVDESSSTTLVYSKGRTATFVAHSRVGLPNEACVFGTKQTIKFRAPYWCPTEIEVIGGEGNVLKFPLPETNVKLNYINSMGLHYQCHEIRKCVLKGAVESDVVSHRTTLTVAEIMESIRKQVGVTYPQDD